MQSGLHWPSIIAFNKGRELAFGTHQRVGKTVLKDLGKIYSKAEMCVHGFDLIAGIVVGRNLQRLN
jgi:hypothetical protein